MQKLESSDDPIECVEIKQHSSVLHRPTKLLKEYILEQNFQYVENQMLEINFQNARCTEDTNLNKYVNKKKIFRQSRYGCKCNKRNVLVTSKCT